VAFLLYHCNVLGEEAGGGEEGPEGLHAGIVSMVSGIIATGIDARRPRNTGCASRATQQGLALAVNYPLA
jgi:hypothetical protein